MNRRHFMHTGAVLAGGLLTAAHIPLHAEEEESPLIYLSPLKSNGALSRCQAEVWYVQDGANQLVVTDKKAWRARAVDKGLVRTQVWVGDVGQWQSSGGKYRDLPSHFANASMVTDADEHARILVLFGNKYSDEWGTWGPRFRKGLASGDRVLLQYAPA